MADLKFKALRKSFDQTEVAALIAYLRSLER